MTTRSYEKERKEKVMAQRFEIFSKENLGSVRTIFENDVPWFCVPDVCKILDLKNPTVAAQRIEEEDKAKFNLGLINSEFVNFVNESGLYQLIMRSKNIYPLDNKGSNPFNQKKRILLKCSSD